MKAPAFVLLLATLAFGCAQPDDTPTSALELPAPSRPMPTTREEFLAELSPLVSDPLLVVYAVQGPGGIAGTLEVMARRGGWRRENWSIAIDVAGEPMTLGGSTIQTPDAIFVEGPEGRSAATASLGALADAWLARDQQTQRRVVATIRAHHDRLAAADEGESRPVESVLGVECRATRMAGQDLCMWHAAGLPLRYEGGGFSLQAIAIDRAPQLGGSAFTIPPDVTALPDPQAIDAGAALDSLADGAMPRVATWLIAGLRWPDPTT
jgi:hypothetical protein